MVCMGVSSKLSVSNQQLRRPPTPLQSPVSYLCEPGHPVDGAWRPFYTTPRALVGDCAMPRSRFAVVVALAAAGIVLGACMGGGSTGGGGAPRTSQATLPEGHPVAAGSFSVAAGRSVDRGGVRFSCAAGGAACAVTVDDAQSGQARVTGGRLTVARIQAAAPPGGGTQPGDDGQPGTGGGTSATGSLTFPTTDKGNKIGILVTTVTGVEAAGPFVREARLFGDDDRDPNNDILRPGVHWKDFTAIRTSGDVDYGLHPEIKFRDFEGLEGSSEDLHGIQVYSDKLGIRTSSQSGDVSEDLRNLRYNVIAYRGALEHSQFLVALKVRESKPTTFFEDPGYYLPHVSAHGAIAMGVLAPSPPGRFTGQFGSPPSISGTWSGGAIATPNFLVAAGGSANRWGKLGIEAILNDLEKYVSKGKVRLDVRMNPDYPSGDESYASGAGNLDITFSDWTRPSHPILPEGLPLPGNRKFTNLEFGRGGNFTEFTADSGIRGQFFGPAGKEEAAGTFSFDSHIGAFGAKKQ